MPRPWPRRLKRLDGAPALVVCLGGQDGAWRALPALRRQAPSTSAIRCPPPPSTWPPRSNAGLDLLARRHRIELQGQLAERYRFELGELIAIAAAINSERDLNRLLGLILEKSRYVTGADAG